MPAPSPIIGPLDETARSTRTRRAVEAAVSLAREAGQDVTDTEVLYDVFSVVVHLRPANLVARIPTVLLPSDHADPSRRLARQARELAVVRWLSAQGFPVVAPSDAFPGPLERDGFCMTFWPYVPQGAAEIDAEVMGLTARLHETLATCPVALPFLLAWAGVEEELTLLAEQPDLLSAEELARAREHHARLDPILRSPEAFQAAFPGARVQPIHGDSPIANAVRSEGRLFIGDFELANLGPVEMDLVGLPDALLAPYEAAGGAVDRRVYEVVSFAGTLAGVAALALAPQQPMLLEPLLQAKAHWLTLELPTLP